MQNKTFIITVILFGLTIATAASIASRESPVVVQTNLENIPMQIDNYTGTKDSFSQSVYDELNADKHVYRHYVSPEGEVFNLYIGYYGTAKGGRTGHNPYACLPGAGWTIIKSKEVTLKNNRYPNGVEVNYILSKKESTYNVIYHWYQSAGDKILESGFEQNIHRFIGSVLYNRNDGAFVRVSASCSRDEIEKKKNLAKNFAGKILNILPQYWPVEKEL